MEEKRKQSSLEGMNGVLLFAMSSMCLGPSFQCGYNLGVINAPQTVLEDWYNQTYYERNQETIEKNYLDLLWSITVAGTPGGGIIGGMSTALLTAKLGRKKTLLLNNILAFVAAALMGLPKLLKSYEMLMVGRIIIGIHIGLASGAVPMYVVEISPRQLRGALGTMHQMSIVCAILISQILGLPEILGNSENWPYLLAMCGLPAIYSTITLLFLPESPSYQISEKNREDLAEKSLRFLRGKDYCPDELDELRKEAKAQESLPKVSWMDLIRTSYLRTPLIINIAIHLVQQLSGINAVIYYSTSIFKTAGIPDDSAVYATIGLGGLNVISTALSVALVERMGRRILFLGGLSCDFFCLIALMLGLHFQSQEEWWQWVSIISLFLYIFTFAIGPAPIPWFITSEMFHESARGAAVSISVLLNFSANFAVGLCFPLLEDVMSGWVFSIFATFILTLGTFVFFTCPETKNRPVEEITQRWMPKTESQIPLEVFDGDENGVTYANPGFVANGTVVDENMFDVEKF